MIALSTLDYASVFVFALSGALAASRAQLDLVGFAFVACLTAVGGGTTRDVLLDRNPVFWIDAPGYVILASAAAVLVFFTAHLVEYRLRMLHWLDAVALPIAVAAGVVAAIETGQGPIITVLMGVVTGCMGGLLRDVVCNEVPLVLKQGELYVSAAFAGAVAAFLASKWSGSLWHILIACVAVTFTLRAGSMIFGWSLPVYKGRPPRQ
ncbi:trimeric intracellular cation channel family protein [Aliiroseovarius sp. YM-037]|uniref:trimeric intracellular cation channel family protein n=1 Tax=Aliiroseovarius sp. YM-037 TaxID=3341728 RepID=UPI003A7FF980